VGLREAQKFGSTGGKSSQFSVVSFGIRKRDGEKATGAQEEVKKQRGNEAKKKVISDQISAIRKKEKAYTEITEDAEFAERRTENKSEESSRLSIVRAHPDKARMGHPQVLRWAA